MVIQRCFRKFSFSVFGAFAGLSLVIISIGLSRAIASSENLVFGYSESSLSLNKKAAKLSNQAYKLEDVLTEIKQAKGCENVQKAIDGKDKQVSEIKQTIDQLIVEN